MKAATAENLGHDYNQAISIHAAREGGDRADRVRPELCQISIHAAREGGDKHGDLRPCGAQDFNPRRP